MPEPSAPCPRGSADLHKGLARLEDRSSKFGVGIATEYIGPQHAEVTCTDACTPPLRLLTVSPSYQQQVQRFSAMVRSTHPTTYTRRGVHLPKVPSPLSDFHRYNGLQVNVSSCSRQARPCTHTVTQCWRASGFRSHEWRLGRPARFKDSRRGR